MRIGHSIGLATLLVLACVLSGCTCTQQGAMMGATLGAGAGAIIGHHTHAGSGPGALVGAAVGGLTGALAGDAVEHQSFRPASQSVCEARNVDYKIYIGAPFWIEDCHYHRRHHHVVHRHHWDHHHHY